MGCQHCDFTGIVHEHEPETGFVDVPCPSCIGRDGEEPDIVTDAYDALTEMEAFASGVGIVVLEADASSGHSQDGLDAAGFLLLAKAHLTRAKDGLGTKQAMRDYMAGEAITRAILATRHAQKLLKKEEPCKKS